MQERDLIVGVLAAQAGFATPSEVLTAAAAGLVDAGSESLLTRLERDGILSRERRKTLEALADQALAARNGDAGAVLTSLGAAPALIETLISGLGAAQNRTNGQPVTGAEVPLERPGQYTRLHELGRGSQSIVRAARDEIVGREVALKELTTSSRSGADGVSSVAAQVRFLREVRLVAGLDHPGIVAVHELARREDGTLFCAQKLIRGETLHARLTRCRTLADRLGLLRHVLDACQAVGFAHSKRVVHRDLKPSNVMVGEHGETVVVDWGLAKHQEEPEGAVPLLGPPSEPSLTVAGVALGTPAYMSPEQARGDLAAIDARSDVFSLGAILYQVLTGRPPFEGATPDHIIESVRAGIFHPVRMLAPEAPPELAAIAERALRPVPADRYADAEALAKELSAYLAGGRVRAYQYGTWELLRKFATTHRALTAGIAVAAGALLLSAVVFAVRLEVARRDLARSFIERARTAEGDSDWALAAAYFGAARTKHDTAEARWGVALAGERAIERVISLRGPPDSYTDVGVLPDDQVVTLAASANQVAIRELEGGRVLWAHEEKLIAAAAMLPGGQVRLSLPDGWRFLDAATGKQLGMFDRNTDGRPCPGPYPPPVTSLGGKLLARVGKASSRVLATNVGGVVYCLVSDDGRLVAYLDTSERVHLLSVADGRSLGEKSASGLQSFLFSSHGLVLVRKGWLDMLGAPEGDFSVRLADPPIQGRAINPFGGARVSPDGHLLVVTRSGASRSDLVDLRTRAVRGTIHHSPGWPRFAFSSDGERAFAAGLRGASELSGWRLPRDESPVGHPGHWNATSPAFSPSGRRIVLVGGRRTVEVFGEHGKLLDSVALPSMPTGVSFGGEDMILITDFNTDSIVLRDVVRHRMLWEHRCRSCGWTFPSDDGSRVAAYGLAGIEVWDSRVDRVLFAETARLSGYETKTALSPDGRRFAWTESATAYLRDLESGGEKTLLLDGKPIQVGFSPDSSRLAVMTPDGLSLWDVKSAQALWAVSHPTTGDYYVDVSWTSDGQSILVRYPALGTELFEAESGERLALFPTLGSVLPVSTLVSPDLRAQLVVGETGWELRPLPQPASDSPADGLEKTLRKTGLALQGVEVVAAP